MYCSYYKSHNQSAKDFIIKNIVLLICAFFIVTSLLSVSFILLHSNHEHDHDGANGNCTTCIHLTAVENSLKQLSTAIPLAILAFALYSLIYLYLMPFAPYVGHLTPVKLKVQLNN